MTKSCQICSETLSSAFRATVLGRYDVRYWYCQGCGFLCADEPFWLAEAYSQAINRADTGLVQRNLQLSRRLSLILYGLFGSQGRHLDLAGGYGMLVRLMRDIGFDFYWEDLYCQNLLAQGFEAETAGISTVTAVTAFEVLEHLADPLTFIESALNRSEAQTLIFTTELFDGAPPGPDWWYYAFETGQHISFYQGKTLKSIASRLGLRLHTFRGMHILAPSSRKIETLLHLAGSPAVTPLAAWVRTRMTPRTLADHRAMLAAMAR